MPTQQNIRDYLVPANNVESTSIRQFTELIMEEAIRYKLQILTKLIEATEKLDAIMLERDDLKTRLIAAESTAAAALDQVAALRGEMNELKEVLSQRQDTIMRDSDHEDDHERERVNDETDAGEQIVLPEGVTTEVLKEMVRNHQCEEDNYFRRSLMITVGSAENGDFSTWRHKMYCMGLHFLYHEAVSHFVTGRGNLRLTYRSEYEMRKNLIEARKFCKSRNLRNIHIDFMVPKRYVDTKKRMMRKGRQLKANGLVGVYDVLFRGGHAVLRTYSQTQGVKYYKEDEIPEQEFEAQIA